MECFAQRYCQLNPDIFTNTDTCYVLSFAIIMLNTSLHNPSVKDKPTVEQFISMNRGINNGGDLPRELLESLYESIRTEPFKIPQDDGNDLMHTFFNPDKEGWLWKQGGRYKSWKRRWFILNDNCLYYFEYTTDKEPRGIIPLENILVRFSTLIEAQFLMIFIFKVRECKVTDKSKPHCFELYAGGGADIIKACKTDSEGKVSRLQFLSSIFLQRFLIFRLSKVNTQFTGCQRPQLRRKMSGSNVLRIPSPTIHFTRFWCSVRRKPS